jgi:hypothetical protein
MPPFVDHVLEVEDQDHLHDEDDEAEYLTEGAERGKPGHWRKREAV